MEEKETEIERNKDESQENKKWNKSLRLGNLPVEERRTDEERRKTFTDLLTETSRKRYESTSACIFFTETIFFTQNSWNA